MLSLGLFLGSSVGVLDGAAVGTSVGVDDGTAVGTTVGEHVNVLSLVSAAIISLLSNFSRLLALVVNNRLLSPRYALAVLYIRLC